MRIDTKMINLQDRLKSLNDTSQNLQKLRKSLPKRPRTTEHAIRQQE